LSILLLLCGPWWLFPSGLDLLLLLLLPPAVVPVGPAPLLNT
jgi:hypothetical protein